MGKTFCEGLLQLSQKSTDDSVLEKEQDEPIAIIKRAPVMEDSSQDDYDSNDEDRSESNTSKRYYNDIHDSIIIYTPPNL